MIKCENLYFSPDFDWAMTSDARRIDFSTYEKRALQRLSQRVDWTVTREQLIEAMSGQATDSFDRSADFIINRLRKKLGDSAKSPRFIGTVYGEGYRWLAQFRKIETEKAEGAFLVIGPVFNFAEKADRSELAPVFTNRLADILSRQFPERLLIVVDENCPPPADFGSDAPEYSVEICFIRNRSRTECAVNLKRFMSGETLHVSRHVFCARPDSALSDAHRLSEELSGIAWQKIWEYEIGLKDNRAGIADAPLPIRLQKAKQKLLDEEGQGGLAEPFNSTGADKGAATHKAELMRAISLHSAYVIQGWRPVNGEIMPVPDIGKAEDTILDGLPIFRSDPILSCAAAKLLYFMDRGHEDLSRSIAVQTLEASNAFATAFATLGQIEMFEGETDAAMEKFDRGIEIGRRDDQLRRYMMVLKYQAAAAGGRFDEARRLRAELKDEAPEMLVAMAGLYVLSDETELPPTVQDQIDRLDETAANAAVHYLFNLTGRLLRSKQHRRDLMLGPINALDGKLSDTLDRSRFL